MPPALIEWENTVLCIDVLFYHFCVLTVRLVELVDNYVESTVKFVYVHWVGESVPFTKKGKFGVVHGSVQEHFQVWEEFHQLNYTLCSMFCWNKAVVYKIPPAMQATTNRTYTTTYITHQFKFCDWLKTWDFNFFFFNGNFRVLLLVTIIWMQDFTLWYIIQRLKRKNCVLVQCIWSKVDSRTGIAYLLQIWNSARSFTAQSLCDRNST